MVGGCLCASVRYRTEADAIYAGHCYCLDCRKASGAGHVSAIGVAKADLQVTGELKAFAKTGGSGKTVRRWFCPECGSLIYSESDAGSGIVSLSAGTLDDPNAIRPQSALFTKDRPVWDRHTDVLIEYETVPNS